MIIDNEDGGPVITFRNGEVYLDGLPEEEYRELYEDDEAD